MDVEQTQQRLTLFVKDNVAMFAAERKTSTSNVKTHIHVRDIYWFQHMALASIQGDFTMGFRNEVASACCRKGPNPEPVQRESKSCCLNPSSMFSFHFLRI